VTVHTELPRPTIAVAYDYCNCFQLHKLQNCSGVSAVDKGTSRNSGTSSPAEQNISSEAHQLPRIRFGGLVLTDKNWPGVGGRGPNNCEHDYAQRFF
jgi:hypothetical protein